MILLQATPFDIDEPEGSQKSTYLSKKDLKLIAVVLVVLIALLTPIYMNLRETANEHICYQNLTQISKAMGLYASQNDDRLPPVFLGSGDEAYVDAEGRPFAWGSLIQESLNGRSSLACPSSSKEERARVQHPLTSKKSLEMSYGMYGALSDRPISLISNPDEEVVVAETSNYGANDTYDPMPLMSHGKPLPQDGFLLGYSDGNERPTKNTTAITRLAFGDTKSGEFKKDGPTRHKDGIFYLTVSGAIHMFKPPAALIKTLPNAEIQGPWATPPDLER